MKLKIFKALWGMEGTLEERFKRIAEAGYDGVEGHAGRQEARIFRRLLDKYHLDYIHMIFTGGPDHEASFAKDLEFAAKLKPLQVTAHSGKDSMTEQQGRKFFKSALQVEKELGLTVAHETHRGRILYNPWVTARLLEELPDLKVTADLSHWCVVTGSLLEDIHIHGRVGYSEGPQVPDPRAPEYQTHLKRHEGWWKAIVDRQLKEKKRKAITFTPEFGPPDYMHTLPFTRQPVADLWEVCLWMANRFREKYSKI
jgi:hypothetical protein